MKKTLIVIAACASCTKGNVNPYTGKEGTKQP